MVLPKNTSSFQDPSPIFSVNAKTPMNQKNNIKKKDVMIMIRSLFMVRIS